MPITAAKHIWYNGKLVPWDKAQVHVLAHVERALRDHDTTRQHRRDAVVHAAIGMACIDVHRLVPIRRPGVRGTRAKQDGQGHQGKQQLSSGHSGV